MFRPRGSLVTFYRWCSSNCPKSTNTNLQPLSQEKTSQLKGLDGRVYLQPKIVSDANKDLVIGDRATVQGIILNLRKLKEHVFMDITDGMTKRPIQVTVSRDEVEVSKLNIGSCIVVQGSVGEERSGRLEVTVSPDDPESGISILSEIDNSILPYNPFKGDKIPMTALRGALHVRPLTPVIQSILRVRSEVTSSLYQYMKENDFTNITTPIITQNDCEGGCDAFKIEKSKEFFNKESFLTVSGQLHLEVMTNSFGRVFTLSPCFRAENSQSRRHLSEFSMLEVEESFMHDVDHLMDRVEHLVRYLAQSALDSSQYDLDRIQRIITNEHKFSGIERLAHSKKYIRITYEEVVDLINGKSNLDKIKLGDDLKIFHEKFISDYFESYPVFITHYPKTLKPFYMKTDGDNALCFDLIVPVGGELCGGSLREDNYDILNSRLEQVNQQESLGWYLDLRKMGSVPHGGFGIGFDRLIQTITGVNNVRDVIPFPRWPHHLSM